MSTLRPSKKFFLISGISLGVIILLLTIFNFWFINHTKNLLETMVETRSKGKLKLNIQKLSYNYLNRKMTITRSVFYSADSNNISTSYKFNVRKITLKLKALLPFLLEKKLLIDYLDLITPEIRVSRLRYPPDKNSKDEKVSVPFEMGKIYKSIQDALQELQVERFQLYNGKFTLENKADPGQKTVSITNIDLHIDNLRVDSSRLTGMHKILFSDNIILNTYNQNITFPDGRHRLKFSSFRINLKNQLVEFDSCTISGIKTDSSKTAYSVFFEKLRLANADFDTLYKNEVIKADTVFCLSPKFILEADISNRKDSSKRGPRLENIIQQLTGDLLLANVIVSNAAFDITTINNGKPNTFTSYENNFEMQGLRVNQNATDPIKVESFAMAIRNYENFIKDSSYQVQFDSVLFREDRIYLSNFLFNKLDNGRIINSFRIPQFYLGGLSWDDLVFEKKLKAEQATLFNPSINYTYSEISRKQKGNKDIFKSLAAINDYMDLDFLDIQDGKIDFKLDNDFRIQLDKATMSIKSSSLLNSTELAGIKNSLTNLNFENGKIHAGNLDIELKNIHYINQNGQLSTENISIKSKNNKFIFSAQNADIEKLEVNEKTGDIIAKGITWKKGDLLINLDETGTKDLQSVLELNNFKGLNTRVSIIKGTDTFSTTLNQIAFDKLEKIPGKKIDISGLLAEGNQLNFHKGDAVIASNQFTIADNNPSVLTGFIFQKNNNKISANIKSGTVTIIPEINSFIDGKMDIGLLKMDNPSIDIELKNDHSITPEKQNLFAGLTIKEIKLDQPIINFNQRNDTSSISLNWKGNKNSADHLYIDGFQISNDSVFKASFNSGQLHLSGFNFKSQDNKEFNSGDAVITATLDNFSAAQEKGEEMKWQGSIPNIDGKKIVLGNSEKIKGNLTIDQINISNLAIASSYIKNLKNILLNNQTISIKNVTGNYADAKAELNWQNASFDRETGKFLLDSFSFTPALGKDSFIASQTYQKDYIKFRGGKISIEGFNTDSYLKDDILKIKSLRINNTFFDDFRDRRIPRKPGELKLLPVAMINKIPLNISIDTIQFTNGKIVYAELNEKTGGTGTIPITKMTVTILPVKNYNNTQNDSLRLYAEGYVMDSVHTQLHFHQSYNDSLGSFVLTANMGPANATIMNPVLIPLASAKLRSGYLDRLNLTANGNEYYATGEMKLLYHDLKISVLTNGKENEKAFKSRIINFFANTFLVKNKNKSKKSAIYFERMRDRSFLQYIVKIYVNGISSSIGIINNKKLKKQARKKINEMK